MSLGRLGQYEVLEESAGRHGRVFRAVTPSWARLVASALTEALALIECARGSWRGAAGPADHSTSPSC